MLAHDASFFGIERAWLEKDAFRHDNFADIVQPTGDAKLESIVVVEAEASGQESGVAQQKVGMAVAEILFGVDTASEEEKSGAGLFVCVSFETQKSLDALQGVPEGNRGGPNVGGASFVPAVKIPLVGSGLNQDDGSELIERVLFETTTEREAAGFRQGVVKKD